jgi:hypothetical protein
MPYRKLVVLLGEEIASAPEPETTELARRLQAAEPV